MPDGDKLCHRCYKPLPHDKCIIPAWKRMKWENENPPSIAAYVQGLQKRPASHWVWHMPDGVDLQTALRNLHDCLCWCGKRRGRNTYGCCESHTNEFGKAVEYWRDVQHNVRYAQNNTCEKCKKDVYHRDYDLAVDHIVPIIDGGSPWDRTNLQLLCSDCHGKKTGTEATTRARVRSIRKRQEKHRILTDFDKN